MKRATYLVTELLKIFLLFSIPGSTICFVNAAVEHDLAAAIPLLPLWLIPLLLIFVRQYVRNFFLFALCHLIWIGYLFLPLELIPRLLAGAYLILTIAYSYVRKYTGRGEELSTGNLFVACGTLIVLYFLAGFLEIQAIRPYLVGLAVAQILIFLVSLHILNVNETLFNVGDMMSQPAEKLRQFNGKIAAMYLVIVAAIMLLAVVLRLDVVFTWIGKGALALLRVLLSLLNRGEETGEISEEFKLEVDTSQGDTAQPAVGEPFILWVILEKILLIAVFVGIIVGIVYLLYRFYKAFNKNSVQELATEEFTESSAFVEKEKRSPRPKGRLWDALQMTPEKKIRRLYFHKISRFMKKGDRIKPANTPVEIEQALRDQENLQALTRVYQKARYSDEPITNEEIREVKT